MGDANIQDSPVLECPDTQRHGLSVASSSLEADSCYCKVLVTNHLAGIIIGQAGHEIRTLKNTTGAKIVLSPHGMYFPGTSERIAAIEGPEQAVFQVLDWILDKMADQRQLLDVASHDQQQQQQQPPQPHEQLQQELSAAVWAPRATCFRICVPRAVVGSLIGKNGGYIQSLRVATGAAINISPLFVTAEEACAERIVSVESRRKQSLKTAAFTLIRKVNSHPEKASCRHVCYFRKHSFESPLAEPIAAAASHHQPAEFRLIRQQQQLQQHQQHELDTLRRRTVSLVMGNARTTSPLIEIRGATGPCSSSRNSSSSNSLGEQQFAAFKRFCEARGAAKINTNVGGPLPEIGGPSSSSSFTKNMQEVAELSRAPQATAAAAAAASASAAAGAAVTTTPAAEKTTSGTPKPGPINNGGINPWESLSTACSSAAGSIDRLPPLTEERREGALSLLEKEALIHQQKQRQQQQQVQQYPSLILLGLLAVLLAVLLRLLLRSH